MSKKNSFSRHESQCTVCQHASRSEIEDEFVNWSSPAKLAKAYCITRDALYRHAHAVRLMESRSRNVRIALEKIIERADSVEPNALEIAKPGHNRGVPTMDTLIEQYKAEKMPDRRDTRRTYSSWIRLHIMPKWGQHLITDVQARPVELWLESLALAPKSRAHIRGILSSLWNFAMWKQAIPMQVNPISLVTVKGASKRVRKPRSLTVEQFRLLLSHLHEPHRTIALMCTCFGLRISECLALRWADIGWLDRQLRVERGIVERNVTM